MKSLTNYINEGCSSCSSKGGDKKKKETLIPDEKRKAKKKVSESVTDDTDKEITEGKGIKRGRAKRSGCIMPFPKKRNRRVRESAEEDENGKKANEKDENKPAEEPVKENKGYSLRRKHVNENEE